MVCSIEIFFNVYNNHPVSIDKSNISVLILSILLFLISSLNWTGFSNSKPIIWTFFCFQLMLLMSIDKRSIVIKTKSIKILIWIILIINYLMLLFPNFYLNGRFRGFAISPTVLSVVFEGYVILGLYFFKTRTKYLYFILVAFLVWKTETRINFLFLIMIPMIFLLFKNIRNKRIKFFFVIIFIVFTILIYPLYGFILQSEFVSFLKFGERVSENGNDSSFNLRFHLFIVAIEYLSNLSYIEMLLGSGSETLRRIIEVDQGYDLLPHNDYLRILIDFGGLFITLYLIFLYKIALKNVFCFLFFILYLFTFYHNMVYSFFIPTLLILFSRVKHENDKNIKLKS